MPTSTLVSLLLAAQAAAAPAPARTLTLENAEVRLTLGLSAGHLAAERLEARRPGGPALSSDGGFRVEVVWNDWQAPGKANNGDVFCRFGAADFTLAGEARRDEPGRQVLSLTFAGPEHLGLEIEYALRDGARRITRRLRVFEAAHPQYARKEDGPTGHLLHALYAYDAAVTSRATVLKAGGFGQPVALALPGGGAFAGLEWPAADNAWEAGGARPRLVAGQEMGEPIDLAGAWGETATVALTSKDVKLAFTAYLDELRVAPLRPYTLYNSWYDLRSAAYPRVKPHQVMDEANVLRVARLVQEHMVRRHGITMDAFVLDDGWDVYASGWDLDAGRFPRGFAPIVQALAETGTRLGAWLGPTGGYSFHSTRTDWWRAHGLEVTASNHGSVVGPNYAALFERRTTELAREGVAYFKWDGIQFVDNDPRNGGPIGLYSRRAAMKNVIRFCRAVRAVNPDMFLNVTSGTWLSPWWLRFADQIWMDGGDFGDAEAPSVSTRDSSITYRDMVLYEDFTRKGLWFPVANLMTHGILKGHIDVGHIGKGEPLSKFADEVAFYLARGVTMYELYIAPDVLDDGEWRVLSESLRWARANFDLLKRGEMVGGDPGRSEPYGHVHLAGDRGLLAVRNPGMAPARLTVALDPALGLDPAAEGLLLERLYPTRWISPRRYRAGEKVELPLQGYEAAIYRLLPAKALAAARPVDVTFEEEVEGGQVARLRLLEAGPGAALLSPGGARSALAPATLASLRTPAPPFVRGGAVRGQDGAATARLELDAGARRATFAVLLRPEAARRGQPSPALRLTVDGAPVAPEVVEQAGAWSWYTAPLAPGVHAVELALAQRPDAKAPAAAGWTGRAEVWVTGDQQVRAVELAVPAAAAEPLPPAGRGPAELPRAARLGEAALTLRP